MRKPHLMKHRAASPLISSPFTFSRNLKPKHQPKKELKMSISAHLALLIAAFGADVKAFNLNQGALAGLTTATKANLVAAVNEVHALVAGSVAIDDNAGDGAAAVTWSADKIFGEIESARVALRNELRAGAGAALDTFAEVAAALAADETVATALADAVAKRVRFDAAQALSVAEKTQARDNIGAADAAALTALTAAVGNTEADLVALYTAAKA
jgi:hypothetical protein